MSRKNKLLIVLLSVIFCFSAFSLTAFAVGEGEGEGGYSDVIPGDNQGGDENGGNGVDVPPENGGGDSGNGGNVDNNGENNGENNGGNAGESNVGENNGENYGENNGENVDNNFGGGYVDNNGGEYNYGYYEENNGNAEEGGYGQGYEYSGESSYLGGGQTYVEPENIAPSASLYNSSGSVSEKTLSNNDWSDISERLKNASGSADDGDDFGFIQNDKSLSDNGGWMLIVSIVCFALSAAGILYFIVLTVQNNKNRKLAAAETGRASKSSADRDYYGDGYRTSSAKRSKKSSKFDTAEVSLPQNSQGRRYKNSGRRYR